MKRLRLALAGLLLWTSLGNAGGAFAADIVFCIGGDGHVALELALERIMAGTGGHHGVPCADLVVAADPRFGSQAVAGQAGFKALYRSATLSAFGVAPSRSDSRFAPPMARPRSDPSLAGLRTVILIV